MKLNYRDRIILLIVIAVVILAGGFFGLVKPRYNDIKENKAQRDTIQAEWDGLDAKIQQIPTLRDSIKKTKASADELTKKFYTASDYTGEDGKSLIRDGQIIGFMKPYQLDMYMRTMIDEANLKVVSMEAGEISDTTLDYYYYTPVVPTTAILDLADLNGNYTAEINKKLEESNAISERVPESLFVQQYGISVKATKDDLWAFMTTISEKNKAIRIDSISIADTNFGYDPETGKLATGAETMKSAHGEKEGQDEGISQATIVLNLYSVYELDEPVLE